ncbi:BREX-2 system adenine-specific DNA-methyltransferase PglX [Actinomadura rubrisoli]|uniref:site-specific DNA-methyltransferase (adenine-specific) n=1 Tax=Actinomadura rubrisoli TaxID=2530368 RepID=A0A4R5AQM0_9ACTN|nr:BREX-2 system adenine-specific DNA-methyltransferase PglX [Actinomadura rubrisoli]TDD74485.1 BREX-2 system adenine-specific DNA-methyltransferase PglX [Actinomadura rubrisoli]
MIVRKALLTDLKKQVGVLEVDLRERAAEDEDTHARLHSEWQKAREASRIAATYETWLDDRVTQAAVAWVLGTVFLRFCEDNGLIELPFLAGPGDKLDLAQERQADYIRNNPHSTDRDWILAGFAEMSRSPVAAGLFDKAHNPMWQIEIPHHAAKALLAFWRTRAENGEIVHDFTDPDWDTRFLGDLYQDLSEHAKKTYALLQTPEFVEEFILDYTLEPAIDEFGLAGLRLIDPTCGSGHFLLGAFHRILNKWRDAEPATDIWELIRRTLLSVHGVDKNPFATNIARFRLLAAAMKAGALFSLTQVPEFPIIVATGDSLLHGRGAPGIQEDLFINAEPHAYVTEDIYEYIGRDDEVQPSLIDLLGAGSYHVVVGNPPYITVKDSQENENYRQAYKSCAGKYALSVPFAERFFQLAKLGTLDASVAGYVGQITSNSFMKRQFGRKLIEEYFSTIDLSRVVDTSGAFIPGHGTPTVILIGRRQWPRHGTFVRTVMGVNGEPGEPPSPEDGLVWRAIIQQIESPGSESKWVSVEDIARERLNSYPWSLSGGGAAGLMDAIEGKGRPRLRAFVESIGFLSITGDDEVFTASRVPASWSRQGVTYKHYSVGENVRDWSASGGYVLWPYEQRSPNQKLQSSCLYWPYRTGLRAGLAFKRTREQRGMQWHELIMLSWERADADLLIAFADVATHNHFTLLRGDRACNQHAPVIKLPGTREEGDYLRLLAILNSSTACFWLKQVSYPKGGDPVGDEGARVSAEGWSDRYEFTGTKLQELPLPAQLPLKRGRRLDSLAQSLADVSPKNVLAVPWSRHAILADSQSQWESIRRQMVAEQEELDWEVYGLYDLLDVDVVAPAGSLPEIRPGERAFEIVLARKIESGNLQTQWFHRHGSTPITEIPEHWPDEYKRVVEKRIKVIENRRDIALIERPECKRRWLLATWEEQAEAALREWLLAGCEERGLWFADDEYGTEQPRAMTVNQLADRLRNSENFVSVARLHAGDSVELSTAIAQIVQGEHVPYLATLRYKDPSGLRKRVQWENMWEQQREEDRIGKDLGIAVPPKYTSADFLKASYWRNRGKLDVPKERFISYPGSSPDGDSSLLLGWAGWDHREQAQALMMLIEERATQDGWDAARLTPLLAGLAEVLPWVWQWHGEIDPAFGQSPADAYTMYLEAKQTEYGISDEDLKNWRPEKPKRGGRKKQDT